MVRRAESVVFEIADHRAVILNGPGDELITLNSVGTMLWLALEHPESITTLLAKLSDAHPGVAAARLGADLEHFVDEMMAAGLLVHDARG